MTKREKLADYNKLPVEYICCEHCDRKSKKEEKIYCPWLSVTVNQPNEDYCTFFIHTQR